MKHISTINCERARKIDEYLVEHGGWRIDTLIELAGLSVAQVALKMNETNIHVLVGPGNNGADGLAAAKFLAQARNNVTVWYPIQRDKQEYKNLVIQCKAAGVRFIDTWLPTQKSCLLVDCIFGFSFHGSVREPFCDAIEYLKAISPSYKVLAVDIPSGWNVDQERQESVYMPNAVISLTLPKVCMKQYKGMHFVGGNFLTDGLIEDLQVVHRPHFEDLSMIVDISDCALD